MRTRLIIVFLIIGSLALYFFLSQRNKYTTVEDEDITFAFEKPEEITKIFIAQRNSDIPITIEKKGEDWVINGKYPAWKKKVDFLIYETFPKIKVKGPAPKAARANVISKMAVTGIKVEIYTDDPSKPASEYYVGQATTNMLGTYFWKEGAKTPYVVYIPGLDGYLTPRYIYNEDEWISRTIFSEPREDIKRISVEYPANKMSGFVITQLDSTIEISTDPGNPTDINISAVRSFINHFEKLNFEGFASIYKDSVVKAVLETTPFVRVELENKAGKIVSMEAYYLPTYDRMHGLYDNQGNMLKYDPNRFLAVVNNMNVPVVIQDYTFRKVFVDYKDFLLRNAIKVESDKSLQ